jgi:hypothetical protein
VQGVTQTARKPREQTAAEQAAELILFADGFEIAFPDIARRARVVARETIWLVDMLQAERSARAALQTRCDTQQELLGKRVLEAIDREPNG